MLVALLIAGMGITVAVQAVKIGSMKKEQELKFYSCIQSAAYSLSEYQATGYKFQYDYMLSEMHSASVIALLLSDDTAYDEAHDVLTALYGSALSQPEDFVLILDELSEILEDFASHRNVRNMSIKLNSLESRLTAMLSERISEVK